MGQYAPARRAARDDISKLVQRRKRKKKPYRSPPTASLRHRRVGAGRYAPARRAVRVEIS